MATSEETLRAAIEVAFPPGDGIPSGLEVGADRHVREALDSFLPGSLDLLAALLDAQAAERGSPKGFASLDALGRAAVLRSMLEEEIADVRELAEAVILFGAGSIFSEWSGYDRSAGTLDPPPVWGTIGFGGPSRAHPDYRERA